MFQNIKCFVAINKYIESKRIYYNYVDLIRNSYEASPYQSKYQRSIKDKSYYFPVRIWQKTTGPPKHE